MDSIDTFAIEDTARKLDYGYVYAYHWLRYNMYQSRYASLRRIWAARCYLARRKAIYDSAAKAVDNCWFDLE